MAKGMGLCCCFIVVVMALSKGATAEQTYEVGDSLGWVVPPNSSYYSEWASNKTFYVGDMLSFNWTGLHTVRILRTAAEYDNCSKNPAIKIGSPVVLTLNSSEPPYYFYCTVDDHCKLGQKFSINVLKLNSAPVAPPPSPSFALSVTIDAFVAVLSTMVTLVLIYI